MKTEIIGRVSMGIALLGLLAAPPALAQKGGFELGVGGGLITLDDKLGGDTGVGLELRAGYFVNDRFEVEVQSSQASSILEGAFRATTLNAVYHFGETEGLVPYVLVGAGTADAEIDALFVESIEDDGTALRVAFGVRDWLGKRQRASLRIELSALNEDSFNESSTHFGLTGTFSWRFGG